ncbi:uncharacterized protein [Rutidosis leptorrhynchoides]|uniref:uncharacterized protein n=1 Tax=Rutidosis leptorrhynchoides TaxID=125765 RepID=UPI003A98E838
MGIVTDATDVFYNTVPSPINEKSQKESNNSHLVHRLSRKCDVPDNATWLIYLVKYIKNLVFQSLNLFGQNRLNKYSTWNGIRASGFSIDQLYIPFSGSFVRTVHQGNNTRFWKDIWFGDKPFAEQFERLFRLEQQPDSLVKDRLIKVADSVDWRADWNWFRVPSGRTGQELVDLLAFISDFKYTHNPSDEWSFNLIPSGNFLTSTLASLINEKLLPANSNNEKTLRNNLIPQKLGIFIWRAKLNRLPVLTELDKRGIDLDSVLCPICKAVQETVNHILFECSVAKDVWLRVSRWWNTSLSLNSSLDDSFLGRINSGNNTSQFSKLWQSIEWVTGYSLWKNRNNLVFKRKKDTGPMILHDIQVKAFEWVSNRSQKHRLIWSQWLLNPSVFDDHG